MKKSYEDFLRDIIKALIDVRENTTRISSTLINLPLSEKFVEFIASKEDFLSMFGLQISAAGGWPGSLVIDSKNYQNRIYKFMRSNTEGEWRFTRLTTK
jgi:hypothetical protein